MKEHHFLRGARVYLSGPMDSVASRADEKKFGWRNRVGDFLRAHGAIVFGNLFDGFGFADYPERFSWEEIAMDERERLQSPQKPLLPFLERLTRELPERWDNRLKKYVPNDDWLLWEFDEASFAGGKVRQAHESGEPPE